MAKKTVRSPELSDVASRAELGDARLSDRAGRIMASLSSKPQQSLPLAMGSEAELEGLYRFLSNPRVTMEALLEPFQTETARACRSEPTVLVIHDSTLLEPDVKVAADLGHTLAERRGFIAHVSLAVSADGARRPLGILHCETLNRTLKSKKSPKKKRSGGESANDPSRESLRWDRGVTSVHERLGSSGLAIHVMDAEGDSYSLLSHLESLDEYFVVRMARDRIVDGSTDDSEDWMHMSEALLDCRGRCERSVALSSRPASTAPRSAKKHGEREERLATLSFGSTTVALKKPRYLGTDVPETIRVQAVHVNEVDPPANVQPVQWILLTNAPVETGEQLCAIVDIYRTRWLIEEFFKALKTGCAYESRRLETFHGLRNVLGITLPIACRMLRLRAEARASPDAPATHVLSPQQISLLAILRGKPFRSEPTVADVMKAIAEKGGHHAGNGQPGWLVLIRGYQVLLDFEASARAIRHADAGKM